MDVLWSLSMAGPSHGGHRRTPALTDAARRAVRFGHERSAVQVTWTRHDGASFSFNLPKQASVPTQHKKLEHSELLELHQLLIARRFVTSERLELLLYGLPPVLVATRPIAAPEPASQLITVLLWLKESSEVEGPPLRIAMDNAHAVAMDTATNAQREQFGRLLARLE
jgi:hypothetical protein